MRVHESPSALQHLRPVCNVPQPSTDLQVQLEAEGTEMLAKQRVKLMSMTPEKKWKDKGQVGVGREGGEGRGLKQSTGPSSDWIWAGLQGDAPALQGQGAAGAKLFCPATMPLAHLRDEASASTRPPLQGTLTLRRGTGEDAAGKKPYFVFTTDSGALRPRAGHTAWAPAWSTLLPSAGSS